jgi:hypothetical protein
MRWIEIIARLLEVAFAFLCGYGIAQGPETLCNTAMFTILLLILWEVQK